MPEPVDYDRVAPDYDRRYDGIRFPGIEEALAAFAGAPTGLRCLEVGCGTGFWLDLLRGLGASVAGLEPSHEMLARAGARVPAATLRKGTADRLPWDDGAFDRVFCVNAVHHFPDVPAFFAEARRVLGPGGGLMVVGLDPSSGVDRWFVYDFFEGALDADVRRYPTTSTVEQWLAKAGFAACGTAVAHHMDMRIPARLALDGGMLVKNVVSQLSLLDEAVYEAGIARIRARIERAESTGDSFFLDTDLRFYATTAWVPG